MRVSSSSSQSITLGGFEGIWEGSAIQQSVNISFTIKVTIMGGQYTIDYPSLDCGGKLYLLSNNSDRIEFNKQISYGKEKCTSNGKTVLIKSSDNGVQFEWYDPNGTKDATGTLVHR